MQSQHKLQSSSVGEMAGSALPGTGVQNGTSQTNSQHMGGQPGNEGGSRILSAETINDRQQRKAITDVLQEIITIRSAAKDTNNEISLLRFDNDMVTTFFDNITKLSDQFTYSFIEELRKDMETIIATLYQSANELAVFYTYLLMMLRKLDIESRAF